MAGFIRTKLSRQFFVRIWRTSYWRKLYSEKVPDGKLKKFGEIPMIEEDDEYSFKDHDARTKEWFKVYGPVVTEYKSFRLYVHLFHLRDFTEVYLHDGKYLFRFCKRWSHQLMGFRESRSSIFDSVGLHHHHSSRLWDFRNRFVGFATKEVAESFLPYLEEVADDLVEVLNFQFSEGDGSIELLPVLFRWVLECVGVIALSVRLGALSGIGNENKTTVEALARLNFGDYSLKTNVEDKVADMSVLYSLISYHMSQIKRGMSEYSSECLLKTFMDIQDGYPKLAHLMAVELFTQDLQMMTLILLMSLYHLARDQKVQDKARADVEKLIPYRNARYYNTVKGFQTRDTEYLHNILWETLRISPPIIGNGRELLGDVVLGGYIVPRGINVILHHQVACMMEENFEEPLKFKPERYPCVNMVHLDYAFGNKNRASLGRYFAFNQMSLVLAKILRNFTITYEGEEVKMINGLFNQPEKPLFLKFHPIMEAL